MAIETELKLAIETAALEAICRHPAFDALTSGNPPDTRELYSVYFDTPDLKLHRQRMALRLRRVGDQWIQTLKGGGEVQGGLHRRNEWEAPVATEKLDFEVLKASGGVLPEGVEAHLVAVFVTEFTRRIYRVSFEEAVIELCLDRGEIRAGEKIHPISEIELELKRGEPQQLFALARQLGDIAPLQIELTNKAEYGYRLCGVDAASGALPPAASET